MWDWMLRTRPVSEGRAMERIGGAITAKPGTDQSELGRGTGKTTAPMRSVWIEDPSEKEKENCNFFPCIVRK